MLVDRFSVYHGGSFFQYCELLGMTNTITNSNDFIHGEKPQIFQSMGIAAIGAGIGGAGTAFAGTVAGAPLGIQIQTADHKDSGTSKASTYARIGDSIEIQGKKKARIAYRDTGVAATSVLPTGVSPGAYGGTNTGHVIVAYPFSATTVLGTPGPSVASRFRVFANSNKRGSDSRESLAGDLITWKGDLHIMREFFEQEGSAAANVGWIEVPYEGGGKGFLWTWNQHLDQYMRMIAQMDDNLVFSERTTSTDAVFDGISTTGGLIEEIKAGGYTHNYTGGMWSDADWNVLIKYLIRNGGAPENILWSGIDWRIEAVNKLEEKFDKGAVVYGNFNQAAEATKVYGKTGKELALHMGFSSLSRMGFTFHLRNYEGFDHPQRAGLSSLGYTGDCILTPTDTQNIYNNGGTNQTLQKSLEIAFLGAEGYTRTLQNWVHGGAIIDPVNRTSGEDVAKFEWLVEYGLWPKALNRFVYIQRN